MSTIATDRFHLLGPHKSAWVLKRFVDITCGFVVLVSLLPLMALLAILIYFDNPGPIFYISERIGKDGYAFPCFKFRTMVEDADSLKARLVPLNERDTILFKLSNDPRVTRIGVFLRKHSLDELPQLLNVLRGEIEPGRAAPSSCLGGGAVRAGALDSPCGPAWPYGIMAS